MSFVERSIILWPYLGRSTIGGSTVYNIHVRNWISSKCLADILFYQPQRLVIEVQHHYNELVIDQ